MVTRVFYIVDVFAEEKYAGNQLAVFQASRALSDGEMQRIANEMNFSETTFILSEERREGGYDVRIFTPKREVPFAGHPVLGTACVIQREIVGEPVEKLALNLKVGQIPVAFTYKGGDADLLWMEQTNPTFGRVFEPTAVSKALHLGEKVVDARFPVQEVSTGLSFIIVPLNSLDAVKRATLDKDEYFRLIKDSEAKALLIFCPEVRRRENDLSVRVFADYYGVPEDPATGSANGCLAAYTVKYRYFGTDHVDLRVEQGYEIGRPSLLFLRARDLGGRIAVSVGGRVIPVARGELL